MYRTLQTGTPTATPTGTITPTVTPTGTYTPTITPTSTLESYALPYIGQMCYNQTCVDNWYVVGAALTGTILILLATRGGE